MNKQLRRLIAAILALTLTAALVACGGDDDEQTKDDGTAIVQLPGDTADTADTADGSTDGTDATSGETTLGVCVSHSWSDWTDVAYDKWGRPTERERHCLLCGEQEGVDIDYDPMTDTAAESNAAEGSDTESNAAEGSDTEDNAAEDSGTAETLDMEEAAADYATKEETYGMGQGQTKYTHVLNDASVTGFVPMSDLCKLYTMCPKVEDVRVYSLTSSDVQLSYVAAVAVAKLFEAAYTETGMVANLRTGDNFTNDQSVGYADYKSYLSIRISFYDKTDGMTYSFSHERTEQLRTFILAHAAEYGFIDMSALGDEGHFRYVGVPHAAVMTEKGMTLAEYGSYLKSLAQEGKSLQVTCNDTKYTVTWFAMTNGVATVSVPDSATAVVDTASAMGDGCLILTVRHRPAGSLPYELPYQAPLSANRADKVICLDAGHGRVDPGACYGDYQEKTLNLAVAQAAAKYLKAMGYTVIFTREGDTTLTNGDAYSQANELAARVNYAKENGTDLYISFHCNSVENPSPTAIGPQLYFNQSMQTNYWNYTIANTFQAAMNEGLASFIADGRFQPVEDSDVRDGNYYVLNDLSLPAILIEMGFICNDKDVAMLSDAEWQEAMGYSVALAVEKLLAGSYLGLQ